MKRNMGLSDRIIRAALAAVGFCPLYLPFGISTRRRSAA